MVELYLTGTSKEIVKGGPLQHVRAVAVDQHGYIYVTNSEGNDIYKADQAGSYHTSKFQDL